MPKKPDMQQSPEQQPSSTAQSYTPSASIPPDQNAADFVSQHYHKQLELLGQQNRENFRKGETARTTAVIVSN